MYLLLAATSFVVATTFAWSASLVKKEAVALQKSRRQFLAEPARAAGLHCAAGHAGPCQRRVDIRVSEEGRWEDLCEHNAARTFRVTRYYRITLTCKLPLHKEPLPSLTTVLLR